MSTITIEKIEEQLHRLSPDKLASVYDFVSYLVEKETLSEGMETMLASEDVLKRDWDIDEDEAAWADL